MMTIMFHKPVMLSEAIDSLEIKENGIYVDLTFGGGGHSKEILKRIILSGKMYFFIGGTASYVAYGIVVWACLYLPIAVVSSLRETSILFAVLLGLFFLKEKINLTKSLLILGLFFGVIILRMN